MNTYSLKPFEDKNYLSTEEALKLLESLPKQNEQEPPAPAGEQSPDAPGSPDEPASEPEGTPSPASITAPRDYLILPSHAHGSYSYPDLLVAKSLSHHGNNWYDTHAALHAEGFEMLTLRQFVDFLNLLKSGKAFDGRGNKVSSSELETILKEITEKRDPRRAEWLDAKFENKRGKLYINYEHRTTNGKFKPKRSEPLLPYLAQDKTPGIDLTDYLNRATAQGLPPANAKSGSLYYWSSANNGVAGFGADAGGSYLYCGDNPQGSNAALGVRRRRAKI